MEPKLPKNLQNQDAPLRIPFKCVVCNGFGTLKNGDLICHACDGKGYLIVAQEGQEYGKER